MEPADQETTYDHRVRLPQPGQAWKETESYTKKMVEQKQEELPSLEQINDFITTIEYKARKKHADGESNLKGYGYHSFFVHKELNHVVVCFVKVDDQEKKRFILLRKEDIYF